MSSLSRVILTLACVLPVLAVAPAALADWTLDNDASRVSFVSVKDAVFAESNHFRTARGSVSDAGAFRLVIETNSVETHVEDRNRHLRNILFEPTAYPEAVVIGSLDMTPFQTLAVGDSYRSMVSGTLTLVGIGHPVEAEVQVTRAGPDRVVVTTLVPTILEADWFDLFAAIDELRKVVSLRRIATSIPVSFTLTFAR